MITFKILILATLTLFLSSSASQANIMRFMQVDQGVYRGSQPTEDADYEKLKTIGIKTLIDLRSIQFWEIPKERAKATAHGLLFRHAPIGLINITEENVNRALNDMLNPGLQPVFVHCQAGKDRTGLVIALYRVFIQKWTPEQAYAEWKALGFNALLFPTMKHYFREHTEPDQERAVSDSLNPDFVFQP